MKRALLALAVCALLAVPARADRDYLTYKVRAGDSLALLAAEYYGDRNHAVFIMVANKPTWATSAARRTWPSSTASIPPTAWPPARR